MSVETAVAAWPHLWQTGRIVIPAASQERPSVAALYGEHRDFVARLVQRFAGAGHHVEDLVQEIFLTAHRQHAQFDPARAKATTWLYAITRHHCLRHQRGSRRRDNFHERFEQEQQSRSSDTNGPLEIVQREQHKRAIHRAIAKLPFKQREVFVLYELEQMQGAEIAEMLAIAEGTVWTRLHHARRSFEKSMRALLREEPA